MKKWQWFIIALVTYFVFLVMYMPATYVVGYIQNKTNNLISFQNVGGTLFKGNAESMVYDGLRVNSPDWSLSFLPLLLGKVNVDLNGGAIRNTDQIYIDASVSVSMLDTKAIKLKNTQVFVPAKPMFASLRMPVVITASGRFRIDVDEFEYDQGCVLMQGTGNWLQAQVNVNSNPVDLGTFDATLSCETPALALQITPENGISLDAKILLDPKGTYSALGSFNIPANFPRDIQQGAQFFGEPTGNGIYNLNLKGKF